MFRVISFSLAAGLALAACTSTEPVPPPVADPATARTISSGELVGYTDAETGAHAWRSVPFAAPPVGDLRWRAPRPAADWEGAREALDPAPWCPQLTNALDGDDVEPGQLAGQEDCLYLNVYAPSMDADTAAEADLPVMMWIHGGSNTWGRADQYNGGVLADRHDVIVVVVQYRLGPMGWFAHESLRESAETADDASANFGTLDQIAALEWIRSNIDAFGGDADNVTIFGESAGGHNVAALLASPRAAGLFHRAVVQSGSFASWPLDDAEVTADESARSIAERVTGDAMADAETLRAMDINALYAAYDTEEDFNLPRIIEDGVVLPDDAMIDAFENTATFNTVPVMTGTNRDETKLFNLMDERLIKQAWGQFPKPRDPALYEGLSKYQSLMWRVRAVDEPANAMTEAGHADVYAYRFDWDEAGKVFVSDFSTLLGAGHAIEIPFVFGRFQFLGDADRYVFTKKNAPERTELSDAMMSYWANFAKTGAPGRGVDGDLPEWSAWTGAPSEPTLMVFDSTSDGGVRMEAGVENDETVAASLAADPTLAEDGRRCIVHQATEHWWPAEGLNAPQEC